MDFTIYVIGGVDRFQWTANALATLIYGNGSATYFGYPVSGFFLGAAAVGFSILLLQVLVYLLNISSQGGKVVALESDTPPFMIIFFLIFIALISVKGPTVRFEDIQTGETAAVDNVPMAFSVPAWIFSTAGYKLFEKIVDSYQSVNGSSLASNPTGISSSVGVYLGLLDGMGRLDSNFHYSVITYRSDCISDQVDFSTNNSSSSQIERIINYPSGSGLTMYYTDANPDGQLMSCVDAQAFLVAKLDIWKNRLTGNDPGAQEIFKYIRMGGPLNFKASRINSPSPSSFSATDQIQTITSLLTGGVDSAAAASMDAFSASTTYLSEECKFSRTEGLRNECMRATRANMESAWSEAAVDANFFTRTSGVAMVVFQCAFFGFAPVILIMGLMKGYSAVSIYLKFVGFAGWVWSWMPVSAFLYIYSETVIQRDFLLLSDSKSFNVFKMMEHLSSEIYLLNNMIASIPYLTAILLGFTIGASLRGMAADSMPAINTQKPAAGIDGASVNTVAPVTGFNASTGGMQRTELGQNLPTFNMDIMAQSAIKSGESQVARASEAISSALQNTAARTTASVESYAAQTTGQQVSQSGRSYEINDGTLAFKFGNGQTFTTGAKETAQAIGKAEATIQAGAGIKAAFMGDLAKLIKDPGKLAQASKIIDDQIASKASDAGFMSRLASGDAGAADQLVGGVSLALAGSSVLTGPAGLAGSGAVALAKPALSRAVQAAARGLSSIGGTSNQIGAGLAAAARSGFSAQATGSVAAAQTFAESKDAYSSEDQKAVADVMGSIGSAAKRSESEMSSVANSQTRSRQSTDQASQQTSRVFAETFQQLKESGSSYGEESAYSVAGGMKRSMNATEFANQLQRDPGMRKMAESFARDTEMAAQPFLTQARADLSSVHNISPDSRELMARVYAGMQAQASNVQPALAPIADSSDASKNKDITMPTARSEEAIGRAENALGKAQEPQGPRLSPELRSMPVSRGQPDMPDEYDRYQLRPEGSRLASQQEVTTQIQANQALAMNPLGTLSTNNESFNLNGQAPNPLDSFDKLSGTGFAKGTMGFIGTAAAAQAAATFVGGGNGTKSRPAPKGRRK